MRSDYPLYGLSVIFFMAAVACFVLLAGDQRSLTVISTIVLGLLSLGLGYSQRPKIIPKLSAASETASQSTVPTMEPEKAQATIQPVSPPEDKRIEPANAQIPKQDAEIIVAPVTAIQERPKNEMKPLMEIPAKTEKAIQIDTTNSIPPPTPAIELIRIKGIKEKRAAQLGLLGIANANDLAKSSAKDVANKLKVSPKIVEKWITEAKLLTETK